MGIRSWWSDIWEEKLSPVQESIVRGEGDTVPTAVTTLTSVTGFQKVEAVNRGVSLIVNACASLDYDVKESVGPVKLRHKALAKLLNFRPNPFQSAYDFRINIFTDFIFEGHVFIYFDGAFIYHVPASRMEIVTDPKTFISGYKYDGELKFKEDEIFYFKDVSSASIYRGASRLRPAQDSIDIINSMVSFQKGFFDNGAVFGLVLTTDNPLSAKAKERTILHFLQKYNPKKGGKRPVILDNGLKPHSLATTNFQEMDFDVSMRSHSEKILGALGVPPLLLNGGNNANISPNLRLFYLETVMPILRNFSSTLERYFGYDIEPITANVSALQPEIKEIASFNSTLVNGGILTPNESREKLRLPPDADPESDKLRVPANIAGSAANPSEGGAPKKDTPKKEDPKKEEPKS